MLARTEDPLTGQMSPRLGAWLGMAKLATALCTALVLLWWLQDWPRLVRMLAAWSEGQWSQFLAAQLMLGLSLGILVWRFYLVWTYRPCPACADDDLPPITVVVPAYNEGRQVRDTLESILASDYPADRLQVIGVDDGSADDTWEWLRRAAAEHPGRVELIRQSHNQGKRRALYVAFLRSRGQVLVTIDSDSLVEPPTLRRLVSPLVRDRRVGAVAGNVRVLNRHQGWLPLMMDSAFVFGFDFVRASQSRVGAVLCTPGALSAYRRDLVMPVLEQWVNQTFLGRPAGIGEDRAMTNLVLKSGHHVVLQQDAVVYTKVPTRYQGLSRMLLRWARSNLRESWLMSPYLFKRLRETSAAGARVNLFMEMYGLAIARPVTTVAVAWCLLHAPLTLVWNLLAGAVLAGLVPMAVYFQRHRGHDCLWAVVYSVFNIFALTWIPVYALLTPHNSGWLTRQPPQAKATPKSRASQSWAWGPAGMASALAGAVFCLGLNLRILLGPGRAGAALATGDDSIFHLPMLTAELDPSDLPNLIDGIWNLLSQETASYLGEVLLNLLSMAG